MPQIARNALYEARAAVRDGKYSEALEKYDYFFEHALDNDPAAYYGVRLSYCLSEWAGLGVEYPEALERLTQKKTAALSLLNTTRDPERFHDFIAICKYLNCENQPLHLFLAYHKSDREFAKSIVRFIWDELISSKQWEVCNSYLTDSAEFCEVALAKFGNAMSVCESNPSLGGEEFAEQIKGRCVRDVSNILLVLKNNGRNTEVASVMERASLDGRFRKYPELISHIGERVGF